MSHQTNMEKSKIGVLLVNLGTPDDPSRGAVYRYLKQFLLDPRVIDINAISRNLLVRGIIAPFRSGKSAALYKKLWTDEGSPLKFNGYKLTEGVRSILGNEYHVELAMRYQSPSIEASLDKLRKAQVNRIIVFPLFPHYASASTGSVHEAVMKEISKWQIIPEIHLINSFPTRPEMIKIFADEGRKMNYKEYDHIIFSYHGLPQRQMRKGDITNSHCQRKVDCCKELTTINQFCYSAQCYATTKALVEELGLKENQYTTCFQSRLGRDPWIQPYTSDILKVRADAGDKKLLVFCPAFVSDCLETIIEVSEEYYEEFHEMGGEKVDLVSSLNNKPEWIETVATMIKELS